MNLDAKRIHDEILMRTYRASVGTSMFAMITVAVIEIMMLGLTIANPAFFGAYLWRYRVFYIALLAMVVSYMLLMGYIKQDFAHRFRILNIVNPLSAIFFFAWSIGITFHDLIMYGTVDPTVFMTFSLSVPSCFYLVPQVYGVVAMAADAGMLFIALQAPNGAVLAINMIIYFVFQFVVGMSMLSVKKKLTGEILKTEEQRDEIENLSSAQSLFFSSMSHEIRTPINAVLGMDDMILRESHEKGILEYARDIRVAGTTLLSLINDILDFSKIGAGKMELVETEYRSAELFHDLFVMIDVRAREKGLAFITDIDEELPSRMFGDDVRIKQVITNLLTNAVKYTKKGRIVLKVECRKADEDHVDLYVSVRDTGIGIKKENIEQLFSTFERIEEKRNREIEGTGLGMTIVTNMLKMMGSRLEVKSSYGKGSDFYFFLRQKVVSWEPMGDFTDQWQPPTEDPAWSLPTIQAPEARILVVDDVELNLKVFVGLLKQSALHIDTALSGPEALEKMRRIRYDCVFMDHLMPHMDGIEALKELRQDPSINSEGVPVIALTANAVAGAQEMYIEQGFSDYLTKPIDGKDLLAMLKEWLPAEKLAEEGGGPEALPVPESEGILEFAPEEDILEFAPEEEDSGAPTGAPSDTIHRLVAAGIDAEEGIRFASGDPEFYLEVMGDYCTDFPKKSAALTEAFDGRDWKSYEITVHALKSTSRTIGVRELSELAAALENAAAGADDAFIMEHHPALLSEYRAIVSQIERILQGEDL